MSTTWGRILAANFDPSNGTKILLNMVLLPEQCDGNRL
jgi:hypothetical protein